MRGSVLIVVLYIMVAVSFLLITVYSISGNHFAVSKAQDLHQAAYYLAETGISSTINELTRITEMVHGECLATFQWDPLEQPLLSLQESADKHVSNLMGPKLKSKLNKLGLLMKYPGPIFENTLPNSNISIQITFSDTYSNPSKIRVYSKGTVGNIVRRIDATLNIYKSSQIYDSKLFDMVLLSEAGIDIHNKGRLQVKGNVYSQGHLTADEESIVDVEGRLFTENDIVIRNGSSATFSRDVICGGISVLGEQGSQLSCLDDVYIYNILQASDAGSQIKIKGQLFIVPANTSASAGVIVMNEANIVLEDEIFINGFLSDTSHSIECRDGMITLYNTDPDSGYAAGLIFANGDVFSKYNIERPELFFQDILLKMKRQASWNFKYQLNEAMPVPNRNIQIEGSNLSILNLDQPIILIQPEEKDIVLPSGEYRGIIFTNGSIQVEPGDHVDFSGIIVSGGKLNIKGSLILREDRKLLLGLLEEEGEALSSFFRIKEHKPLVEIESCREHQFNEKLE